MNSSNRDVTRTATWLAIAVLGLPALGFAQVAVDEDGEPYSEYSTAGSDAAVGDEGIPLLSPSELQELVGPIALYPDDLLAIVLPASTYPLQIVQAGRFLEELEDDPSLEPDAGWDDSVVALVNYPEVIELLNDDLDWTWRLGEAVVAQQTDVIAAVEAFRDRAYAAGNLKSDGHQNVARSDEGIIEIVPIDDEIIYVPYYEPERVVVYQPRPVYYYYPRAYPVYYYPYPSSYVFDRGYFWGVTTAFTIGWYTDRLHVFHHSYYGHPYYGRYYYDRWWYRRPTINVYNNYYVHGHVRRSRDYYRSGDYWRSREYRRLRSHDRRITRNRYFPGGDSGYVTRSPAAGKQHFTTGSGRDYRHKRYARGNDAAVSPGARDNTRGHRKSASRATRDSTDAVRKAVRKPAHGNTRDKIEFRDRSQAAKHEPRKRSSELGHGLRNVERQPSSYSRRSSRTHEPREKAVRSYVAKRSHGTTGVESRRRDVTKVQRVERRHTAPGSERKPVVREAKAGERKSSRSAARADRRREESRSRSRKR